MCVPGTSMVYIWMCSNGSQGLHSGCESFQTLCLTRLWCK